VAALLHRPRESLTAFKSLTPAQLTLLADAIEASFERRSEEIDRELQRTLSPATAPLVAAILRSHGVPSLRRRLIGRDALT
jgi:hypothetical protein